ncbi:unnamed protein product [Xylocopa violacea]|uniref:GATOR2 complex protein WDR24 n=1 Tax=Xylocopa violacea TaxID=135666 RepID=A0ABP1NE77_XYLVO
MISKTVCITQEGPANALALNKDNSQVVIAGRNVFKIFTLLEDRFEEACNLRVGKNLNLNFSCNDVAWNLIDDHILATAATNGAVVVWNLNKSSRSKQEHVFIDHKRTVNKVSFHMTEPMWLISGSQDGTMKCFDLRIKEATRTFYSNTESVRDVQFCPHSPHTFAAVSENGHVQQWDLRKPDRYFQHFTAHSGPIFACDWHPETNWLATASRDKTIKDCTLYHHVFKDATRPASKANPQGLALNPKGDIAYACKVNIHVPTTMKQLPNFTRKPPAANDTFCMASSVMHRFAINMPREPKWFRICAEGYLLSGRLNDICDHNATVARSAGRNDISTVWNIIKTLYANPMGSILKTPPTASKEDIVNTLNLAQIAIGPGIDQSGAAHENDVKSLQGEVTGATSGGDDETETDETPDNQHSIGSMLPSYKRTFVDHKGPSKGDFLFGESEFEPMTVEYTSSYMHNMINNDNDWTLSKEAFPLRHEIKDRSPPPEQFPNHPPDINEDCASLMIEDQPSQLIVSNIPKPQFWDPTHLIEEALRHHAALRDIQTSASILIALGEKRKNLDIETAVQEHWILEYLDILARFKLWNVATQIIQSVWIPSVSQLNQQSTVIHACCLACTKPLQRAAWFCDRCHSSHHALCSVCHQVVRGIYAWCQGCTHGGHVIHMNEWFSFNRQCPTGCGHICEYT